MPDEAEALPKAALSTTAGLALSKSAIRWQQRLSQAALPARSFNSQLFVAKGSL